MQKSLVNQGFFRYGYEWLYCRRKSVFLPMGIIDVYDRVIIEYHIGLTCEGIHAAHILERITRL